MSTMHLDGSTRQKPTGPHMFEGYLVSAVDLPHPALNRLTAQDYSTRRHCQGATTPPVARANSTGKAEHPTKTID